MAKFKAGDKVRVVDPGRWILMKKGMVGVIEKANPLKGLGYAVNFSPWKRGHTCGGRMPFGCYNSGYWLEDKHLELVKPRILIFKKEKGE